MKSRNVSQWWNRRSKAEKGAIITVSGVVVVGVTVAAAKVLVDSGIVVISGKTIVAFGKAAEIIASRVG